MPKHPQKRAAPKELNAWLGKESGKPVHVARPLLRASREGTNDWPVEEGEAQMKKPTIRVTKWLGDIPVEAGCSACPSVIFRARGSGHRPNREEFQKSIQAQFDEHCKLTHSQSS